MKEGASTMSPHALDLDLMLDYIGHIWEKQIIAATTV